ncbi:MAG: hypothetical protein EA360_02720 [Balneolaceae bacterium]|nr:MAG: hypothetical protein EA360_02720 [Balneolaceae bacterium]
MGVKYITVRYTSPENGERIGLIKKVSKKPISTERFSGHAESRPPDEPGCYRKRRASAGDVVNSRGCSDGGGIARSAMVK